MDIDQVKIRFWSKVSKTKDCWLWLAYKTKKGYGKFYLNGHNHRAHRVAYYLTHGKWPQHQALHTCDNPSCVRPSHIYDGTPKQNTKDMMSRNRQNNSTKLSNEDVLTMRKLFSQGVKCGPLAIQFNVTESWVWNLVHNKKRVMA